MKKAKQLGAVGLTLALLLMSVPPVMADSAVNSGGGQSSSTGVDGRASVEIADPANVKVSKEEAIDLSKKLVNVPDDFQLQSVSFSGNVYMTGKSRGVWRLEFTKQDRKKQYYAQISVNVDAENGDLLGFWSYVNDPGKKPSFPPKVDRDAAKTIAHEFLSSRAAGKLAHVRLYEVEDNRPKPPLQGDVQYNFHYDRVVDGIPFKQNYIDVTVNGEGHIIGYGVYWDDFVPFESAGTVIRPGEAEQAIRDHSRLSMQYITPYRMSEPREPKIGYRLNPVMVDASTGEPWHLGFESKEEPNSTEPLAESPLAAAPDGKLNLSRSEAAERISQMIGVPSGMTLEDASYDEYTDPDSGVMTASWNLRWSNRNAAPEESSDVWARVNSRTGELMYYSHYQYRPVTDQDRSGWISSDAARTIAVDLVKQALPHYADQLYLQPEHQFDVEPYQAEPSAFRYQFKRYIRGVEVPYENVYVMVDRASGKVTQFSNNMTALQYPIVPAERLSEEQAKDLLLSEYQVVLEYYLDQRISLYGNPIAMEKYNLMVAAGEIPPGETEGLDIEQKAKAVYRLVPKFDTEPHFLDAISGEWRSEETGDVITLEKVKADDIENHWAEQALQLMIDYKAIDVQDGKVNPNAIITRGELIKMLVIAMNGGATYYRAMYDQASKASFNDVSYDSPYFAYVEAAADQQLIDRSSEEFNPDDPMTRDEVADLIVRALGYGKLAQYENIFNISFQDASESKNKGQVAIVVGLGVMTLSNGKFEPRKQVTRAEAATAFYRYLQTRATLQDRPLYY